MKKVIILGGGTFSHVRSHLSLAAPAFGSTAKHLHRRFKGSKLVLTKMADSKSKLVTNEDVSKYIKDLIKDPMVGTIIFNVAMCDYTGVIGEIPSGKYTERLKTSDGNISMVLAPAEKIISTIRRERPDIFLVGFKTTTYLDPSRQFSAALEMMKRSKCNLVLANDVVTRNNMVIVPEEAIYYETIDRNIALMGLEKIIKLRQNLTYDRTDFEQGANFSIYCMSSLMKSILKYLIINRAFKVINGNGFTPGHFCYKSNSGDFFSSGRKRNHNKVFKEGLVLIKENGQAHGEVKPSVGFTSQKMIFDKYEEFNCIIHTHNQLKTGSENTYSSSDAIPMW